MRRRTRESMRMGETDLAAIRYLLAAQRRGQNVSPKDLAANLDISSASVSVMIDRLEKSGHVSRRRHPTDGRGVVVVATEDSETEVRETLGIMHARMLAVAESLSPAETAAVARFLTEMAVAIEDLSSESS
ncbi:MarR family transcriptional regulator [Amnibacterium flavum]|uniref:MarR family transcriptional regulator n=2 Tax=Amnibacterium flavum TaxID=2173173 RepID=A0A2V1HUS2_9MICO|nr:MarR family transcriptional regulator [Amnibacterium flavum]